MEQLTAEQGKDSLTEFNRRLTLPLPFVEGGVWVGVGVGGWLGIPEVQTVYFMVCDAIGKRLDKRCCSASIVWPGWENAINIFLLNI